MSYNYQIELEMKSLPIKYNNTHLLDDHIFYCSCVFHIF